MITAMLAPCGSCDRHVRVDEVRCPFCGGERVRVRGTREATARLGRAAIFAFHAVAAASLATLPACGGSGAGDRETIAQPYGAPPDPDPPPDPPPDDESIRTTPAYGAPALPPVNEPGAPVAAYGAPPPR